MRRGDTAAKMLAAAISEAVFACDLDGRVTLWNDGARALWRLERDEALGAVLPHVPSDRRRGFLAAVQRTAASGAPARADTLTLRRGGGPLLCSLTLVPLASDEGAATEVACALSDADAEWRVEELLAGLTESLSEQLRAPLTALFGYAQLLRKSEVVEDRAQRARVIQAIEERGRQLADAVDDLSLLERIKNEPFELAHEPTDLSALVMSAVAAAENSSPGRRFVVDYDARAGMALVDRRLLGRALDKLMARMAAITAEGSEVHVTFLTSEGSAQLRVVAAGSGEDVPARGDVSPRLGHAVLLRIIEAHGGSVETKRISNGRAVIVRLPLELEGSDR